jgi:hypothetical protein
MKNKLNLSVLNFLLLGLAVLFLLFSYVIMSRYDLFISPIVLVISYVIIIPISLIIPLKIKRND